MEAILLIGLQASGKSTFCRERFFATHLRISLDMLKTRSREKHLLQVCLDTRLRFVVDNTNPTAADRQRYIEPAKQAGFRIIGYYFEADLEASKRRNGQRSGKQRIPVVGILGTHARLEVPAPEEGFDELYRVKIAADNQFVIEEWTNEAG